MKQMRAIVMIIILIFSTLIYAADEAYDDCLLVHLKGAKQDYAAHLIRQACSGLYNRSGVLLEKRRLFLKLFIGALGGGGECSGGRGNPFGLWKKI